MAMALDDYIYCSPFLTVSSLDALLEQPSEDGRLFDVPDPQPGVDTMLDRVRAYEIVHVAVEDLPHRQRAVIHALYFVGYTVTQTARLLKISAAAVVKLRAKAVKRLMTILAPMRHALLA